MLEWNEELRSPNWMSGKPIFQSSRVLQSDAVSPEADETMAGETGTDQPPQDEQPKRAMSRFGGHMAMFLNVVWTILFLPWLTIAPLAGMAFDGGYKLDAYMFVTFVWTYPLSVAVAWFFVFVKKKPLAALLPCVNVLGVFSDSLWK